MVCCGSRRPAGCGRTSVHADIFQNVEPCCLGTDACGDGGILLLYLDTLVLAKLYLRLHSHLGGKDKGLALLDLHDADLRPGHQLQLALIHSLLVGGRNQLVHGVLVEKGRSVHLLDDLARHLALAEARNGNLLSIFQVSVLESALQFLGRHLNRQLCHVLL